MRIRIALLALLTLCTACSKFLDDPQPTGSLPVDAVFETGQDLEEALTGVYDACQNGHLYGRNIIVLPELISGNAVFSSGGYFGLEKVSSLSMTATDWYAENTWLLAYQAVNQLNAILDALPAIRQSDAALEAEQADRIRGEALFLRGLLYFDLVRLFALPINLNNGQNPGVPLMLEPILKKEDFRFPVRTPVKEVYEQINRDLAEAAGFLPEYNTAGKPGKFAAQAFLTRVAFQEARYADAAGYAEAVLAGNFSLTATPQDFFLQENNTEEIWSIQNTEDDPGGGLALVFGPNGGNQCYAAGGFLQDAILVFSPDQQAALEQAGYRAVDLRLDTGYLAAHPLLVPDNNHWRTNKYENVQVQTDDVPVIRLAEILLLRAEALARMQGINPESIELLNQVRRRALRVVDTAKVEVPGGESFIEFAETDFPDAGALIEAIIRERRVELAFEGNYLHDLKRLKRDVQGEAYFECRLLLPIPQREVDANSNLEQHICY